MSNLFTTGQVQSLCLNGHPILNGHLVEKIQFQFTGPRGDVHSGLSRILSGHDGEYMRTSRLQKGAEVFNWRSWTGLSCEEISEVEQKIGVIIPQGCLLENLVLSGIPNFSQLAPTTRLVFPQKEDGSQVILAVWEENSPCKGVGDRLQKQYGIEGLSKRFIAAAQGKRGVMGLVLSEGFVELEDRVGVYPPVQ